MPRHNTTSIHPKITGKNFDWSKGKRVSGPLISKGMDAQFKREAQWLADRVAKGKPSANAKTSGPVKVYTPEEIAAFTASRTTK